MFQIDGMDNFKPEFAIKTQGAGPRFPAIQASNYRPSLSESLSLVLTETFYDLLSEESRERLNAKTILCDYGGGDVLGFELPQHIRWVILNRPRLFAEHRETGVISQLVKGEKLAETGKRTISKLFLAAVLDDDLLLDSDGNPQVFTLRLTSNKTNLLGGKNNSKEEKTIFNLNEALNQRLGRKAEWLVPLVSVSLVAEPRKFASSFGKSSVGVMFALKGDAKFLSPHQQQQIFDLISTDEFKKLSNNPFESSERRQNGAIGDAELSDDLPF